MIRCGNTREYGEHSHETVPQVKACHGLYSPEVVQGPDPTGRLHRSPNVIVETTRDPVLAFTFSIVPAGRYAIMIDGKLRFFKVDKPEEGRWAGYTFMRELFGSPGNFSEDPIRSSALRIDFLSRIAKDGAAEAAALFGRKVGRCGRCMSPLTDVRSRAAGYGEICAGHMGWPYPSEEEARRYVDEYNIDTAINQI